MRLQEEYIKRHNLNLLPIYHVRKANLILKLQTRPQVAVEIKWETTTNHPGYYVIEFKNPNHNGWLDGNYFVPLGDPHYYQYNQYANFITRWVKNLNFRPIKFSQVRLAVWEMFLYCFDGWVVEHSLEERVFPATDPMLSEEERLNGVDNFLDWLAGYDTLVSEIYECEFQKYQYDYAQWLAELINVVNGEANNAASRSASPIFEKPGL